MKKCSSCASEKIHGVIDLGDQPLANNYLKSKSEPELKYSLKVFFCENCLLVQSNTNSLPKEIFESDYAYLSTVNSKKVC